MLILALVISMWFNIIIVCSLLSEDSMFRLKLWIKRYRFLNIDIDAPIYTIIEDNIIEKRICDIEYCQLSNSITISINLVNRTVGYKISSITVDIPYSDNEYPITDMDVDELLAKYNLYRSKYYAIQKRNDNIRDRAISLINKIK